jgi:uncharacterized tellurite resistance protein B-like protein
MNLETLSNPQQMALLDLLVLAMYSDGHLARAEDVRIQRVLTGMGFKTTYDHQRIFDASIARVRQHVQSAKAASDCASQSAAQFNTPEERREVFGLLSSLAQVDGQTSEKEADFLNNIRTIFHL